MSMRRRRKILPGGNHLAGKASLPMRDRRDHLVQVQEMVMKVRRDWRSSSLQAGVMEPVIATESSRIPMKVMEVAWPSVFSCFTGAFMLVQSSVMSCMFCLHISGPADS